MDQFSLVRYVLRGLGLCVLAMVLASCSASPSRNIFGSYFPSWMVCTLIAIVCTVGLRWGFVRTGIDSDIRSPVLVYLCVLLSFTLGIWLLWLA